MSQVPLVIKLGGAVLSCGETLEKLFGAISATRNKRSVLWCWYMVAATWSMI